VGKKCLYKDKKSMAKGKINPDHKGKIVGRGSKSVAVGSKTKVKALISKKSPVKGAVKSKSVAVKSAKKAVTKKPVSHVKSLKPKVIAKTNQATSSKSTK